MAFVDGSPDLQLVEDRPSFYDWRRDDEALKGTFSLPLGGLLFDVEHADLWMKSWGERPKSRKARKQVLSKLVAAAPKLIPVYGHRYLLADPLEAGNPVLSVHQADIIVYGSNLRNYLFLELSDLLGIPQDEAAEVADEGVTLEQIAAIPFWGELMTNY